MNEQTQYRYEKRIKELEAKVQRLTNYEGFSKEIIRVVIDCIKDGTNISNSWIVLMMKSYLLK